MIWYRSSAAYASKFGRRSQPATPGSPSANALAASGGGGKGAPDSYAVECYLQHQGTKFVDRFDANSYVSLTRTLDSHDVGRGRGGIEAVLGAIKQPVTIVAISSDVLYPPHMQEELAELIPRATLRVVESVQGHDGFLLESDIVGGIIRDALGTLVSPRVNDVAVPAITSPPKVFDLIDALAAGGSPFKAMPYQMPTAAVLSLITEEMKAKRKAANLEGIRTAGALGAVAW